MTTQTHASSARPTTRSARLRRLVAVGSLAPLLAVAACSGDEPITTQGRVSTQASAAGGSTAAPTTSASTTTATTPGEATGPTETALKVQIKDPQLGHLVTATKLVRDVPWPEGNPVGEESFEIIAVEVTWKAGSRYSAALYPWMLTLGTTKTPYAVTTTEFGSLRGTPLVAVARNIERSGWVYFKVDRGSDSTVTLSLQRPDYKVSTTGKTLPRHTFTATLTT
jgi:hypothetical protein